MYEIKKHYAIRKSHKEITGSVLVIIYENKNLVV